MEEDDVVLVVAAEFFGLLWIGERVEARVQQVHSLPVLCARQRCKVGHGVVLALMRARAWEAGASRTGKGDRRQCADGVRSGRQNPSSSPGEIHANGDTPPTPS